MLTLGYLRSYSDMGTALLTCLGECKCAPTTVDSQTIAHMSVEARPRGLPPQI